MMRKPLNKRIIEQIKDSSEVVELVEKNPDLKHQIYDIISALVDSTLGLTLKDTKAITNEALGIIEDRKK